MSVMQASPKDFAQCAPRAGVQQFVSVPTVEHILVEQPVTFRQYKQKTNYIQVPVPQKYSKIMMAPKMEPCRPIAKAIIKAKCDTGCKPVYGCGAGPFTSAAYSGGDPAGVGVGAGAAMMASANNSYAPGQFYYASAPMGMQNMGMRNMQGTYANSYASLY